MIFFNERDIELDNSILLGIVHNDNDVSHLQLLLHAHQYNQVGCMSPVLRASRKLAVLVHVLSVLIVLS